MLTITVEDAEVSAFLSQLQAHLTDLTPAMDEIGRRLEGNIRDRFAMARAPDGAPWLQWADSTRKSYPFPGTRAAAREGRPGNARLLDRFGHMLDGVNYQADATSVRVGVDAPYAGWHEFGTQRMPRRQMLFDDPVAGTLGQQDRETILDVIGIFLTDVT